jgi:hypothetical protein
MIRKIILLLFVFVVTTGPIYARGAKELALDDTWEITNIETENVITKDLKEWIEVYFDADSNMVRISTGEAWPELLQDVDGVYTYKMDRNNNKLYLRDDGETVYTISVELSANLSKMEWTLWSTQNITLVGNESPVKRITFTRS